ncbi:MAG: metallophosphoesterase family protein [Bacteroidales bacterium]
MNRRLVISDIHGCSKTFKKLVEKTGLSKTDILFLLGDYIDRGPDSCGVIDFILKLQSEGFDIRPIRGNHEQEMLDAFEEYDASTFRFYAHRFKSDDLIDSYGKLKEPYHGFMKQLPFFIELPDFFLVHGGINFELENPFADEKQLLVLRKTYYNEEKAGKRRIVFGHQITYFENIMAAIENKEKLIPLDNGCVYNRPHKIYDCTRLGKLLCFDLDRFKLEMVSNIDSMSFS